MVKRLFNLVLAAVFGASAYASAVRADALRDAGDPITSLLFALVMLFTGVMAAGSILNAVSAPEEKGQS